MKKTKKEDRQLEEMLKKACPAAFGLLHPDEVTPRYVAFTVPPKIFGPVRKWLDLGLKLEVVTNGQLELCQILIINVPAVEDYNRGRKPPGNSQ